MITMVTFLRGGLYSSLDTFEQLPEGSKLIATVNNTEDRDLVEENYGGIAIFVEPWSGGDEWSRHQYVADLWNTAIPTVTTSLTLLADDDVTPPLGGIPKLLQGFAGPIQVSTCAVYPFKEQSVPGQNLFPVFYTTGMQPIDGSLIPNARDPVFTAAMGLSLWRTSVLKSCLPVSIIDRGGSPMGTEFDVGLKVMDKGRKIYIDGRVRCQHSTT